MLFSSNFQISGLRANLMLEDLKSDLLTSDIFENLDSIETYRDVENLQSARNHFLTVKKNLEKMKKKFNMNYIHKLAHILISFRGKSSKTDFLFFPVFDRNLIQNSEKNQEWKHIKSLFLSSQTSKEEYLCHVEFLKKKLKKSKSLTFILNVNSSPENFKDNLPIMEEIKSFKMDLRKLSEEDIDQEYDQSDYGNMPPVSDYAHKLMKDVEEFVVDTNEFIQDNQMKDNLDMKKKQIGYFEHKVNVAEKSYTNKIMKQTLAQCQQKLRNLKQNLELAYRNSEIMNSHSNLGFSARKNQNSNFENDERESNAFIYGKRVRSAHKQQFPVQHQNSYGFEKKACNTDNWNNQKINRNPFGFQSQIGRNSPGNSPLNNYRSLKDELRDFKNVVVSEFNRLKFDNGPKENSKRGNMSKKRREKHFLKEYESDDSENSESVSSSQNFKKNLKKKKKYLKKYIRKNEKAHYPKTYQQDQLVYHQMKKLRKDTKRMKTSIKELKKLLVKKDSEIEEFKQNEIRMDIQINQYKESVDIISSNNRELQLQVDNLEEKIQNYKEEISELNNIKEIKKKKFQDKKTEYEEMIEDLRAAVNELSSEKIILENKVFEYEKSSEEENDRSKILGEELERMKQEIEEFQMQAIEIQEVSNQRSNKNIELNMKIENLGSRNGELKSKIDEIENLNKRLEREIEKLRGVRGEERDEELREREEEIEILKNENDELKRGLNEEEMRSGEFETVLEELRMKIEENNLELKLSREKDMDIFKLKEKNEGLINKLNGLERINNINDERIKVFSIF